MSSNSRTEHDLNKLLDLNLELLETIEVAGNWVLDSAEELGLTVPDAERMRFLLARTKNLIDEITRGKDLSRKLRLSSNESLQDKKRDESNED